MPENRTLLIVDDEPATLDGYRAYLSPESSVRKIRKSSRREAEGDGVKLESGGEAPYRLLVATNGEEAVAIAEREISEGRPIAAGFFDVKLGAGIDGLQTIQRVRALDSSIHCVVVTAYQDRSVDEINQLFGDEFKDHWDYLNKPFNPGEIVQKARQMVSAWNRRRQLDEMYSQLIRAERLAAVGQVARGVGHEFGNILLRIMGKTDLALMEKDVTKIHEHLKVAMSAAERAGVIVRNLQSFAKAEPQYVNTGLDRPLDEALSLVNHEMTKASLKVERDYKSVRNVRIDQGAIAQVFLNLLINAIHASSPGGMIRLVVTDESNVIGAPGVSAQVIDTGSGMASEVLSRIFEYAFSTKGDFGSGLGLAISKELIDAHRGAIDVVSVPGKGSTFKVWLPISSLGQEG